MSLGVSIVTFLVGKYDLESLGKGLRAKRRAKRSRSGCSRTHPDDACSSGRGDQHHDNRRHYSPLVRPLSSYGADSYRNSCSSSSAGTIR